MYKYSQRYLLIVFTILCALAVFAAHTALAAPVAQTAPQVEAEAAVVMVAGTNQVLFEKNASAIMYPASTTKIMTLITALEKGDLASIVTVSPRAAAVDGSSLDLRPGDKLTLRNMVTGLMLVSGNDAATAIAEHVAGSVPAFVALMNAKAAKLGAINTHFTNPHGLPDPINHYTTAYDLALISAYAMNNPDIVKIVSTREADIPFLNRKEVHVTNTNKLLKTYPGINGLKTGYTREAGDCLVAGARRNSVQLITVVLNDDNRWTDAAALLDYGFQQLSQK